MNLCQAKAIGQRMAATVLDAPSHGVQAETESLIFALCGDYDRRGYRTIPHLSFPGTYGGFLFLQSKCNHVLMELALECCAILSFDAKHLFGKANTQGNGGVSRREYSIHIYLYMYMYFFASMLMMMRFHYIGMFGHTLCDLLFLFSPHRRHWQSLSFASRHLHHRRYPYRLSYDTPVGVAKIHQSLN